MGHDQRTPPQTTGGDDMGVITHLVEEMYEHLDTLNGDIDRLTMARDRMKNAILALVPDGTIPSTESQRPGIKESKAAPPKNRVSLEVTKPAPEPRKYATSTGTSSKREPKYDLAAVADIARNAHVDGRSMAGAVAAVLGVKQGNAQFIIKQARAAGHTIPKRGRAAGAILPGQIRHEVDPELAGATIVRDDNPVEPISDQKRGGLGFASRPDEPERVVETERHGWRPGMGAEVLAGAAS